MTNDELPPLFHAADTSSNRLQARHFRLQRTELICLVAAALLLEITWVTASYNLTGLPAALLLAVALGVRLTGRATSYESQWHQRRAAAEMIRALAWQYAVGGHPYPIADTDTIPTAKDSLVGAFAALAVSEGDRTFEPSQQITDAMQALRDGPLQVKVSCYRERRLRSQQMWYQTKAATHRVAGRRWSALVIVAEVLAVAAAIARGFRIFDFDWAGVLGAAAAAGVAWHQARQHTFLSLTYSATGRRLNSVIEQAQAETVTNTDWSAIVDEAEEVLAREHGLWLDRQLLP